MNQSSTASHVAIIHTIPNNFFLMVYPYPTIRVGSKNLRQGPNHEKWRIFIWLTFLCHKPTPNPFPVAAGSCISPHLWDRRTGTRRFLSGSQWSHRLRPFEKFHARLGKMNQLLYLVVVLSHPLAPKVTPPHGDTANVRSHPSSKKSSFFDIKTQCGHHFHGNQSSMTLLQESVRTPSPNASGKSKIKGFGGKTPANTALIS